MQVSRKPTDGRNDDMWDPDHDYGTTFSVFAGWFLVLVSYLCKLREIEDVNENELDDLIDEMMDDESVDEVTKQRVAKQLSIRERFLRRRVQGYDTSTTSDNIQHIAQEEKYSTEDMVNGRLALRERFLRRRVQGFTEKDQIEGILTDRGIAPQHTKKRDEQFNFSEKSNISEISQFDESFGGESYPMEKVMKLRQRFLKRRVQAFAPIGDDDDTCSMEPAVREALKDAYFGQAPPEPFSFVAGGKTEDKDMPEIKKLVMQSHSAYRERFLRRRVQAYSPVQSMDE